MSTYSSGNITLVHHNDPPEYGVLEDETRIGRIIVVGNAFMYEPNSELRVPLKTPRSLEGDERCQALADEVAALLANA